MFCLKAKFVRCVPSKTFLISLSLPQLATTKSLAYWIVLSNKKDRILMVYCRLYLAYMAHVIAYDSLRVRYFVCGSQLSDHRLSPWCHIYAHGDDGTLISLAGFNRLGFELLLQAFKKYYTVLSGYDYLHDEH